MTVFDKDPLSIVLLHPISAFSSIITMPTCGYLIFFFILGKKPKPFLPIMDPSRILTLLPIIEYLIKTLLPITQFDPIIVFDSMIVL